ncbi:MAG: hypothetical protein AAFO69_15030 [Bacteroidota bacterium]
MKNQKLDQLRGQIALSIINKKQQRQINGGEVWMAGRLCGDVAFIACVE